MKSDFIELFQVFAQTPCIRGKVRAIQASEQRALRQPCLYVFGKLPAFPLVNALPEMHKRFRNARPTAASPLAYASIEHRFKIIHPNGSL